MPNWTTNYLTIDKAVAEKYLTNGSFDFNKLVPMPLIYSDKTTSHGPQYRGSDDDETVIIYLTDGCKHPLDKDGADLIKHLLESPKWLVCNTDEMVQRALKLYFAPNADRNDLLLSGKLRAEALKKYGYSNWYDWATFNWGTKWNACDTYIEDNGSEMVTIEFSTAWCYPSGIVNALAQCETGWSWEFEDEDYTGRYVITPDHLDPELIPGTEPEESDDE